MSVDADSISLKLDVNVTHKEKYLTGQCAVITGASSGIGAACAQALAERGANVVINYRSSHDEAMAVVQACEILGIKAIAVKADMAKSEDIELFFEETLRAFGRLDILVANAGLQNDASFTEMTLAQWNHVINVNLTGQYLCAQTAAKIFIEQAMGNHQGKIIHISSVHDKIPWAGHVNYATSKGGIDMLMKSAALELAPNKIRINCVSPGAIKTDINRDVWSNEDKAEALKKLIPLNEIGEPSMVADAVAWLASDYARYVTGATLYVDGGMTLYPGFVNNG